MREDIQEVNQELWGDLLPQLVGRSLLGIQVLYFLAWIQEILLAVYMIQKRQTITSRQLIRQ